MEKIKAARGTQDILAPESKVWQSVEDAALKIFQSAGFCEWKIPIFEATNLFKRTVGEDSDIVNKEMYTFNDKSDRSLTLRPEGTAGVIRAFVEHNAEAGPRPCKLWYRGPMFRYERPQTGRYRQFHQIGLEAIGSSGPYIDVEIINLALEFFKHIGLSGLTLYINSIGNSQSRIKYREVLKRFLAGLQNKVCEDCKRRFEQNPLRTLDCKVPEDRELYRDAPLIYDCFDEDSHREYSLFKSCLQDLGINFVEDPKLVRGLDYYNHCVFEIKTENEILGQQSTLLAGGRYDNLVELLGGPSQPAVGWAAGMERIVTLLVEKAGEQLELNSKSIYIVADRLVETLKLSKRLREALSLQYSVEFDYEQSKVKKQLEKANKKQCGYVIFYLENERLSGHFKIKDLNTGQETANLSFESLQKFFQGL